MKRGNSTSPRQEVIETMWTDHAAALRRYVLGRGATPDEVDDVVAETFLSLMRLSDHELGGIAPGWLFTVAFRRLADSHRSRTAQQRSVERTAREIRPSPDFDVELTIRLDTRAALTALSNRQRQAIEMRYLNDRTVAEIASRLDVSYQAAESLLARGRRVLAAA